ncbi:MAG: hypothetical protein NUV65_04620 [Candidatus Roizmanbacteria bacterium]|nr:hypothetical protein [Candidatus Roizmanbacteria bacterium]
MESELHWRQKVADQIKDAWRREKQGWQGPESDSYNTTRRGLDYIHALGGISATAKYVDTSFAGMPILDIGAGSTIGIAELQECFFPTHTAWGTVLSRPQQPLNNFSTLPSDRVVFTPAETLSGLYREFIGSQPNFALVTGVMSIVYSRAPEQCIRAISKILPDGGIVKLCLSNSYWGDNNTMLCAMDFYAKFIVAGYGTSYLRNLRCGDSIVDVVLAVKGRDKSFAINMINNDLWSRKNDAIKMEKFYTSS